ncbi:MAG: 16S rRNA (uracil(1498)-N(3))-methyltransferase [Aquisalimonadaceae bacterium]
MKAPRIYVDLPLRANETLQLTGDPANHLRVLRVRPGGPLVLFNGQGGEYAAQLSRLERRAAEVAVGAHDPREAESPIPLTLVQGVSKGDRMDWTIQKAVELGVTRILPVFTERSVVQLSGDRLDKKTAHWRGVVQSACEQCGRNRLPMVDAPASLADALGSALPGLRCLLDPEGARRPSQLPAPDAEGITLLVGPEGGLTGQEVAAARDQNYLPVLLGPRILRTETAGMAALAAFQMLWGDLR